MKFGYARVSTQDQNLSLQLDALKGAGCEKVYQEKVSGATTERLELSKLLELIREGDTLPGRRCGHLETGSSGTHPGAFDSISCRSGTEKRWLG